MAAGLKGGEKLVARLAQIQDALSSGKGVRVGFLEGAMHPDANLPVATIAAINEFGATVNMPAREQTIYRSIRDDGEFNKHGRFVKAAKANYATTHHVDAYTIKIPARPFFRHMIADKSSGWGASMAGALKATNYDAGTALRLVGEGMRDQLQASIRTWTDPRNADSTIAKKGFNQPLVDSNYMVRHVGVEVTE